MDKIIYFIEKIIFMKKLIFPHVDFNNISYS